METQRAIKTTNSSSIPFLIAGLIFGVIGGQVIIVQPGFVEGLVSQKSFSEQTAGLIASAEMTGVAVMTVLLAFLSQSINWRLAFYAFLGVSILGNLACIFVDEVSVFAAIRFAVGMGAGGIVSLGFGALGMTPNPDRSFGMMVMLAMTYGAGVFFFLPSLFGQFGFAGLLTLFVICSSISVFFVQFMPKSGDTHTESEDDAVDLPRNLQVLALAAMLTYFIAQGAIWAYLALIGASIGADDSQIASSFTLSQGTGIIGALIPVIIGSRFGRYPLLALGISAAIAPLLAMTLGLQTAYWFFIAVLIYNFGFNLTHPYLLSVMASFDKAGRVVIYAVAMQMIGFAVGPAVGAMIIGENGNYTALMTIAIGTFALALAMLFVPTMAQRRLVKQMEST